VDWSALTVPLLSNQSASILPVEVAPTWYLAWEQLTPHVKALPGEITKCDHPSSHSVLIATSTESHRAVCCIGDVVEQSRGIAAAIESSQGVLTVIVSCSTRERWGVISGAAGGYVWVGSLGAGASDIVVGARSRRGTHPVPPLREQRAGLHPTTNPGTLSLKRPGSGCPTRLFYWNGTEIRG